MSLFNLITWWSGQVSDRNQCLDGAPLLCVSRFNSFDSSADSVERDTIFVASSSGMLSIYQPSDVFYTTGNQSPTDVIMECQLNEPIIDIKCGKFAMTKSDKYSIAILHPTRVTCYSIAFADGLAEYGKQFHLNVAFDVSLSSPAFSLCQGSFGGVKSKEFFCVNHLANNELRFFEQDGIATEGVLPQQLRTLPSKMLYLSRVDCFVVMSMPNDVLECYKYQDLITSTVEHPTAPVWTFCVGEFVLEMATHQMTNSESVIVILGEHNLICLTDGGVIKFIKKLDYTAITFHSFVIGYYFEPDARLMIAIASDMDSLFVYECSSLSSGPINCKLIWSTQLPFAPVSISRANFEAMPGGLVLLGSGGQVIVGFFGTEPQVFKVPPISAAPEGNSHQESVHRELERLEGDIKQGIDFTDVSFINAAINRDLEVSITTKPGLMPCKPHLTKKQSVTVENPKMVCVLVKVCPRVYFEQIQIALNPPPPLAVNENSLMLHGIEAGKEIEQEFWIYVSKCQNPFSLSIPVIVSIITRQGIPRIIEKTVEITPELFLRACSPQKEAQFKVTVTVDSSTREILNLIPEFATDTINQQALGLQSIYSKDTVTIVCGKNSKRYRIQSDSPSSIPIVLELLLNRIQKPLNPTHSSINATPEGICISQTYFVEQLLATIATHSQCRAEVKRWDQVIANKSRQMRLFQRKLMLMLQQDPPHPSYNSAGKLLRLTHADLTELQEQLLASVDGLRENQILLGNHLRLLKLVIQHSKMPLAIKDNLNAVFVHPIVDWIEMSWEETLAPALELMAHIGPLGKNKHGNSDMEDIKSFAQLPFDMERFVKNLKYVLEKLEGMEDSDYLELDSKEKKVADVEQSDWLVDKDNNTMNSPDEGDEDHSVNDMDMV